MVFILFGSAKFTSPDEWIIYLPAELGQLMARWHVSTSLAFSLLGGIEILIGIQLIVGFMVRTSACLAVLEMGCIVTMVGFDHTGVRDLGLLLGVGIPLILSDPANEPWTVDCWLRQFCVRSPAFSGRIAWILPTAVAGVVLGVVSWTRMDVKARESPSTFGLTVVGEPGVEPSQASKEPRSEPIRPLPLSVQADPVKVDLGRSLFHERQLSGDGTLSCASCHALTNWGMDGLRVPVGIRGSLGAINTPTVYNSLFNLHQFWDGRAKTLQEQALGPVENPNEMGASWVKVQQRIGSIRDYVERFEIVFPGRPIDRQTITEAIAAFESTLVTPQSRFDRWLRGDDQSLQLQEVEGYRIFKEIGCIACHQGVNIGGNMYQTMGKFGDYFKDRGGPVTAADLGRFNVTGSASDRHKFKVPSLRNVEKTAPYFHDGTASTLDEAVNTMARYQLGRRLEPEELRLIVAFLRTLTGELPQHAAR